MAQPKTDTRTQRQKFIDAARERGASEEAAAWRRALVAVAKAHGAKPAKATKQAAKKRKRK